MMKYCSFEYDYALQHPAELYTGAIVIRKNNTGCTYYMVRVSHDVPILTQVDEDNVPVVRNADGDYLLNLRTGSLNVYTDGEAVPIAVGGINKEHELEVIRIWSGVTP